VRIVNSLAHSTPDFGVSYGVLPVSEKKVIVMFQHEKPVRYFRRKASTQYGNWSVQPRFSEVDELLDLLAPPPGSIPTELLRSEKLHPMFNNKVAQRFILIRMKYLEDRRGRVPNGDITAVDGVPDSTFRLNALPLGLGREIVLRRRRRKQTDTMDLYRINGLTSN
jgi:hypothetical protein